MSTESILKDKDQTSGDGRGGGGVTEAPFVDLSVMDISMV